MDVGAFNDFLLTTEESLQVQVHRYLVGKISNGQLPPGTRLPASRRLAMDFKLSRNTVSIAIEQLKAEGFLRAEPGNGVFVNKDLPKNLVALAKENWHWSLESNGRRLPKLSYFGQQLDAQPAGDNRLNLPFTPGLPDLKAFPDRIWQKNQRQHQDRKLLQGYDGSQGYLPLRIALAEYLNISRGVRCEPEQIIITQGAQQAISLCALVLLNEGDSVFVESPGYRNAAKAFLARKAKLLPAAVDTKGLVVDDLPDKTTAKIIYTTPTHQYPLGGILPAAERIKLLDWAASRNIWIIEDDYDSEFHFHGKTIPAMQGMADQTPVLYIGSFSKTLFPALRLGFMVVPQQLAATFVLAKEYTGGESSLLAQAVTADFIVEGHFGRHLRKMRHLYEQKWDHLRSLLTLHLSGLATPIASSAGMHLVLNIAIEDDQILQQYFMAQGFGSTALSSYITAGNIPDETGKRKNKMSGLVLGFANTSEDERLKGVLILKEFLQSALKR
ncbi:MAG: PLP-dependent aminotransferase family protein [Pseudomonadales bacterium]|nr:PLP-dependent aminotransferase family protein [Pseudomonadales bacterium]